MNRACSALRINCMPPPFWPSGVNVETFDGWEHPAFRSYLGRTRPTFIALTDETWPQTTEASQVSACSDGGMPRLLLGHTVSTCSDSLMAAGHRAPPGERMY